MWRAMLACLEGRLEESERLRAEAVEISRRAGDRVAELFSWIQAAHTDLERAPVTAGTDVPDRLAVQPVQSAFRSDLPLIYAELGRTEEAREELEALAANDYAAVNGDMNWLASMSGLAQGAALLQAHDRAAELYERLHPYRDRAVLVGRAALCLGPVEMHLGILGPRCAETRGRSATSTPPPSGRASRAPEPGAPGRWSTAPRPEPRGVSPTSA